MIIKYECEKCEHVTKKYYRKADDIKDEIECEKCGGEMIRILGKASTKTTSVIDPGHYERAVEISNTVLEEQLNVDRKHYADYIEKNKV